MLFVEKLRGMTNNFNNVNIENKKKLELELVSGKKIDINCIKENCEFFAKKGFNDYHLYCSKNDNIDRMLDELNVHFIYNRNICMTHIYDNCDCFRSHYYIKW